MLDYLIALLDYSNDFAWQAAKASHAVLLWRLEQGEVISWSETDKIGRIRRANAQRHFVPTQSNSGLQKFQKNQIPQKSVKSMPCVYYNDNSCNFNKNHETKGMFYRYICSSCFGWQGQCPQSPGLQTETNKRRITLQHLVAVQGRSQQCKPPELAKEVSGKTQMAHLTM